MPTARPCRVFCNSKHQFLIKPDALYLSSLTIRTITQNSAPGYSRAGVHGSTTWSSSHAGAHDAELAPAGRRDEREQRSRRLVPMSTRSARQQRRSGTKDAFWQYLQLQPGPAKVSAGSDGQHRRQQHHHLRGRSVRGGDELQRHRVPPQHHGGRWRGGGTHVVCIGWPWDYELYPLRSSRQFRCHHG